MACRHRTTKSCLVLQQSFVSVDDLDTPSSDFVRDTRTDATSEAIIETERA